MLFDLIGTLLRVAEEQRPYWHAIGEALANEEHCDAKEFNARYKSLRWEWHESNIETPLRVRLAHFAQITDKECAKFEREFLNDYVQRSAVIGGVRDMLSHWQGIVPLGVVSNFFIAGAPKQLLAHHNLLRYFTFVVDSAEVGYRKPHSKIFGRALDSDDRGSINPGDAVMIGDNWHADIEGALAAGLRAAYFSPSGAKSSAVPVIRSWDEFRVAA